MLVINPSVNDPALAALTARVLNIPELRLACAELVENDTDLVNLACTHQDFVYPAMAARWKHRKSLVPLLALIPGAIVTDEVNVSGFIPPLFPCRWSRPPFQC